MRAVFVLLLLSLVVFSGCSGSSARASGAGVSVKVLNYGEIADAYFPYYANQNEPSKDTLFPRGASDGVQDYVELYRISTLVENTGYAATLVALYVTGYDPNLFVVEPLGPYVINNEPRSCYTDVIIQDGQSYRGYAICQKGDAFIGGGISSNGDGNERLLFDAYNLNGEKFLNNLQEDLRSEHEKTADFFGFLGKTGLFDSINVNCDVAVDGGSQRNQGINIGGDSGACQFTLGMNTPFFERSSRGTLLLALHGKDVRNCANGCTIVPSRSLPKLYLAGDNENTPGGEAMYVDFGVWLDRARWPANLNDHTQLFQLTACYLYTTYATPTVCLDPTPALSDGEVCRPGIIDLGLGQPAPLRISRIDQHSQGPRAVFTIYVENTGTGRSFHPGAIDYCSPSSSDVYSRELRDVAKVIDARVLGSLEALDCGTGIIYLKDGRGQITCSYTLPPEALLRGQAYQTTLNIEIGYLYRNIQTLSSSIHRI